MIVGCNEFIQVPFQQLKSYALNKTTPYNMLPKHGEVLDLDNATQVLLVPFPDLAQDGDLNQGLLHDLLALLDNLERLHLFGLMIVDLDNFSKGAAIDGLNDLIPIRNVITYLILVELTKLYSRITHRRHHPPPLLLPPSFQSLGCRHVDVVSWSAEAYHVR